MTITGKRPRLLSGILAIPVAIVVAVLVHRYLLVAVFHDTEQFWSIAFLTLLALAIVTKIIDIGIDIANLPREVRSDPSKLTEALGVPENRFEKAYREHNSKP